MLVFVDDAISPTAAAIAAEGGKKRGSDGKTTNVEEMISLIYKKVSMALLSWNIGVDSKSLRKI